MTVRSIHRRALGFAGILCGVGLWAGPLGSTVINTYDPAVLAVLTVERAWLDAYERVDVAAMDLIVHDDFAITFGDGSMQDKAGLLSMLRAPRDSSAGTARFHTEHVRARHVQAGMILDGILVTETRRRGDVVRDRARYTDLYVLSDGRWQVLASHLSNLAPPSPNAEARRWVRGGNTIVSPRTPTLRITVNRGLSYIGSLRFPLGNTAEVERFVFADADPDGRIRALFVAQFESLLPAAKNGYTFKVVTPIKLGSHDYQTDTGFFDFAEAAAARPGFEADRTRAFLKTHGLEVGDDDFLTARYARIVDDTARHELILFYWENLLGSGRTRADFEPGGRFAARTERLLRQHEARARQRFRVVDGAQP